MIIETRLLKLIPGASAVTIFPFIFLLPGFGGTFKEKIVAHERVHWHQQLFFAVVCSLIIGLSGVALAITGEMQLIESVVLVAWMLFEGFFGGVLLWRALYLLVLPVGWNPFRYYWERVAFEKDGFSDAKISLILSRAPYRLWWM
jgi:hypothetical protein